MMVMKFRYEKQWFPGLNGPPEPLAATPRPAMEVAQGVVNDLAACSASVLIVQLPYVVQICAEVRPVACATVGVDVAVKAVEACAAVHGLFQPVPGGG